MISMMRILLTISVLLLAGTATAQLRADPKPILYPNKHLTQVGQARANRDISECGAQAAGYAQDSKKTGDGLRAGTRSAAKGAVLGTVGGAIMGNTGRGAAAGAVVGATGSALKGVNQRGARDPVYQQYVNSCIEDRGYKVVEWR